jgi:hypothetical protein
MRSKLGIPLSSQATASLSMMQDRDRRRAPRDRNHYQYYGCDS